VLEFDGDAVVVVLAGCHFDAAFNLPASGEECLGEQPFRRCLRQAEHERVLGVDSV
jgi:hypothetical protein